MTKLRQRMIEDMQLRGLSEKTQESYLRSVRQLAEHYHKAPDQISEEELTTVFSVSEECASGIAQQLHSGTMRDQVLL